MDPNGMLDSWKAISRYLNRSVRTCQRLEKEAGLPVHRLENTAKARIFGYIPEIEAWLERVSHRKGRPRALKIGLSVAGLGAAALLAFFLVRRPPTAPPEPPARQDTPAGAAASEPDEDPDPLFVQARRAERAYGSGCELADLDRAIELYRRAAAAQPGGAPQRFGLGHCLQNRYLFHGRNEADRKAMDESYRDALRLAPDLAEAHLGMGWLHWLAGDLDQAYSWFRSARSLSPADPTVGYHTGVFLGYIGLTDRAIGRLTEAIEAGERTPRALRMRGFLLEQAGRFAAAAADLARLCELEPSNGKFLVCYARSLLLAGDAPRAGRELAVAEVLAPGNEDLALCRALAAAVAGEKDKALEAVASILASDHAPSPLLTELCCCLGLEDRALAELERGAVRGPANAGIVTYPYAYLKNADHPFLGRLHSNSRFRALLVLAEADYRELAARYGRL